MQRVRYLSSLKANKLNTLKNETFRHNPVRRSKGEVEAPELYTPGWPRQIFGRKLVQKFASAAIDLASEPDAVLEGGCTVASVLDYVMHNTWRSKYELYFKDRSCAKYALGYRDLLHKVGVEESEIQYRFAIQESPNDSGAEEWQKLLSLTEQSNVTCGAKTWSGYEKQEQWLAIKAVFPQFKPKKEEQGINNKESGSHGVYLILYMMDCMIAAQIS